MEIIVSDKNYEELNRIRMGFIESYLDTKVEFSSYRRIGTDTQLVTIETEEEIDEIQQYAITKIMQKIEYCHKFLYRGFELPIKQLRSMNPKYHKIIKTGDVYYYNPKDLNEELEEFAHSFVSLFEHNYTRIKLHVKQVSTFLDLDKLGLLACRLHNENGRIYLDIDDEKHHMDYSKLSEFIKDKMESSDLEPHYKIDDNIDKNNVMRVVSGKSPLSAYFPADNSNEHIFKLTMAFAKSCKEENLPMFNCEDIVNFSKDILGFEYYTMNTINLIKKNYDELKFENYKEHTFDSMENALAFSIYLSGFRIKHYILTNKTLGNFTVCYMYSSLLDPYVNIDDMKQRVIEGYEIVHKIDKDYIDDRNFKSMSIQELLSCVVVRDYLIFDKHNIQHINPYDNEPLPISYYELKRYQKYGIYNIGNIIKGVFKKPPFYNRDSLKIHEVEIYIDGNTVMIHGVPVSEDMEFSDNEKALRYIHKIWRKGYFLNSLGIQYYLETGDFAKQTIIAPEWFTLENSTENRFYKFLKFNDL